MNDPVINRVRAFTLLFLLAFAVWYLLPAIENLLISVNTAPRTVSPRGELATDEQSTIEIFDTASPSVVFITTTQRFIDPWTRNVFSARQGTGSGFVWDNLGHVITNQHVIKDASEAIIRLNDGRSYQATLVGSSPEHDLAVLRIRVPFNRPPPVPLGTSADLRVGQKVFAIGNPFGLDHTLTTGIVSALDRSLTGEDNNTIDHLIQTDAAINPGNSGGPLLDSAGRLVGINTAIYSPSGAYAGIGFAVPVDTVNRVVPELIANGRYTRPSLGIETSQEINEKLQQQLGVEGVLVLRISPASPAEQAGIRESRVTSNGELVIGDIITRIDGKKVTSTSRLLSRLDDFNSGDIVTLTLWRNGKEEEIRVEL